MPRIKAETPIVEEVVAEEAVAETPIVEPKDVPKKYLVKTQVPNFCGEVAGVQFAYGKAEVQEGWILNWFKEKGYIVEEVK